MNTCITITLLCLILASKVHGQLVTALPKNTSAPGSSVNTAPFNTVGRIATHNLFSGSGAAVSPRVVLTAAHVIEGAADLAPAGQIVDIAAPSGGVAPVNWYWKYTPDGGEYGRVDDGLKRATAPVGKGIPARYALYTTDIADYLNWADKEGSTFAALVLQLAIALGYSGGGTHDLPAALALIQKISGVYPNWIETLDEALDYIAVLLNVDEGGRASAEKVLATLAQIKTVRANLERNKLEMWNRDVALLGFLQNCTDGTQSPFFTNASEVELLKKKSSFFRGSYGNSFQKMLAGYPFATVSDQNFKITSMPPNVRGRLHTTNPEFKDAFELADGKKQDALGMANHVWTADIFGWIGHSGSPLFARSEPGSGPFFDRNGPIPEWSVAGVYVWADISLSPVISRNGFGIGIFPEGAVRSIDEALSNAMEVMHNHAFEESRPPNDFVKNAISLSPGVAKAGSNVGATIFTEEPKHHDAYPASKSVWYLYRPTGLGRLTVRLTRADFHSVIAVYEPVRSGQNLLLGKRRAAVASPSSSFDRTVSVTPTFTDSEFLIVVSSIGSAQGTFDITSSQLPDFPPQVTMNSPVISSASTGQTLSFSCAATDAERAIKSVQFLVDGNVVARRDVASPGSVFLDLSTTFRSWSRRTLSFQAVGEDFFKQIGYSSPVKLVTFTAPVGDTNVYDSDAFATSQLVMDPDGDGVSEARGASFGAGLETGEPLQAALTARNAASVWWRWQAPANGYATITTQNVSFDHSLDVLMGSTLENLASLQSVTGRIQFSDQPASARIFTRVQKNEVFHIRVTDLNGQRGNIELKIAFAASNMPPTALNRGAVVDSNTASKITLSATDSDRDRLSWRIVTPPTHGTLSGTLGNADDAGFPTYTPATNYRGSDSFVFTVEDGEAVSGQATVFLTVRDADAGGALVGNWASDAARFSSPVPPRNSKFKIKALWSDTQSSLFFFDREPSLSQVTVFEGGSYTLQGGRTNNAGARFANRDGRQLARLNAAALSPDHSRWVIGGIFDEVTLDSWHGGATRGDVRAASCLAVFERPVDSSNGELVSMVSTPMIAASSAREFEVTALACQPDGKFIVGGILGGGLAGTVPYRAQGFLWRLMRQVAGNGAVSYVWDSSFASAINSPVTDLECAADGSIFVLMRDAPFLVKLRVDGQADTAFTPPSLTPPGSGGLAIAMREIADPEATVQEDFDIGTYEVTNQQYVVFLNSVAATDPHELYALEMGTDLRGGILRSGAPSTYAYTVKPGRESHPVSFVDQYDAARFINWLHHGAVASGDTEHGCYELNGSNPIPLMRNNGATWFLPTWEEWEKAAYYSPDPVFPASGYWWTYPTRSDVQPLAQAPPSGSNSANYYDSAARIYAVNDTSPVGAYLTASSPSGTFDQGGNVSEFYESNDPSEGDIKGGGWNDAGGNMEWGNSNYGNGGSDMVGFRVAATRGRNPIMDIALVTTDDPNEREELVLAGNFYAVGGQLRRGLARISSDTGTLDGAFDPLTSMTQNIICMNAITPLGDGTFLAGGDFLSGAGGQIGCAMRIKRDGKVHPDFDLDPALSASVHSLAIDRRNSHVYIAGWMQPRTENGNIVYDPVALVNLGNKPPSVVAWESSLPDAQAVSGGTYVLRVKSNDPDGLVRSVAYSVYVEGFGWSRLGTATEEPFEIIWNVPADAPTGALVILEAIAMDNIGTISYEYLYASIRNGSGVMPGAMMMADTMAFFAEQAAGGWSVMHLNEDGTMPITLAARDNLGRLLIHTIEQGPQHGTLDGINGKWIYLPDEGFDGIDEVVVRSVNNLGEIVFTRIRISMQGSSDLPVALGATVTTTERQGVTFVPTFYDPDTGSSSLTLLITTQPVHGVAVVVSANQLRYTPNVGFSGEDSFVFVATDGNQTSAPATIQVVVHEGVQSATLPGLVANLNASDGQLSGISIAWVPTGNTSFYEIWRGPTSDPSQAVFAGSSLSNYWTDTTSQPGSHFYWVRAGNDRGVGLLSLSDTGSRLLGDSDADGMGDAWENLHRLSVGINDSALDSDGDGGTNYVEFVAGTDPTDNTDAFRLQPPVYSESPRKVGIGWMTKDSRNYLLESSADLRHWTPLLVVPGAVGQSLLEVPLPAGDQQGFFRVSIHE
jgi:formylglycine-generating enzyme required for sulfatase activity